MIALYLLASFTASFALVIALMLLEIRRLDRRNVDLRARCELLTDRVEELEHQLRVMTRRLAIRVVDGGRL